MSLFEPLMLFKTGLDIFGNFQKGRSAVAQGKFEYQISKMNADNIREQGKEELRQATEEAEYIKKQGDALIASQLVGYTSSGVTVSGTVPVVMAETAAENKLDEIRTLKRGLVAEVLAEKQAIAETAAGRAAKYRGRSQEAASYLNMGTSILGNTFDIGNKLKWFD